MKRIFTIALFSLIFTGAAFANIIVRDRENDEAMTFIFRAIQDDGMVLYNSLLLPEKSGKSSKARVFRTADGVLEIYSTMSKLLGNPSPFVSTITINVPKNSHSDLTRVSFFGENELIIFILDESEAKVLYDALNAEVRNDRSKYSKSIKTDNGDIELSCTKSKITVNMNYSCTLDLKNPN